jgi:hypothetical protein
MNNVQKFSTTLFAFLLLVVLVITVEAGKPDKPDKPGGGGKPPGETDPPVAVVYGEAVIDGDMREWAAFGCELFPQYWAGKTNKEVLADSCIVAANGRVYVAGWATDGNAINDKAISTHIKFDGSEMVSNVDRILDGVQPEFAYSGMGINSEGWPIALAYEASFDYPYTIGEEVEVILHVSSCPDFDCNDGAGQSSRTPKSFSGVVFP